MKYVFIVLAIIEILYVFKRRLDFLSIGAIGHLIYNYYCAIGEVYIASHESVNVNYYASDVKTGTYVLIILQIVIMIVAMFLYDNKMNSKKQKKQKVPLVVDAFSDKDRTTLFTLSCGVSILITIYNIIRIGPSNLNADKSYIWEQVGGLYIVGIWLGFAAFAYGIKNKKYILAVGGGIPVLLHFFFGSRAYFAAGVVVILVCYGEKIKNSLIAHFKLYTGAGIMAIFVIAYKKMYILFRQGDFVGAINVLFLPETYEYVFKLGEPRIVLANLNYIIDNNIKLDSGDIVDRIISIIPFLNDFFSSEYQAMSSILRVSMNASYGLANNIWGEFWAMGSYPLSLIMFIVWIRLLIWGNSLVSRTDWTAYFWLPIISYFSFYIHRLDLVKALGNAKMCLMAALIFWIVYIFVTRDTKIYINLKKKSKRQKESPCTKKKKEDTVPEGGRSYGSKTSENLPSMGK